MSKVIDILKQNSDLKRQLDEVLTIVRENDIKSWGYKAIEYTFLNANSLSSIDKGPLIYLEEVFSIDRVFLLINIERFPNLLNNIKYGRILFYTRKAFEYFFFAKKPFSGHGNYNLTKEFNLVEDTKSYLIIPILRGDKIVASLNLYSYIEDKFNGDFAVDFAKDLAIKIGYILFNLNKTKRVENKLKECMLKGCIDSVSDNILCSMLQSKIDEQYISFFIKFNIDELYYYNLKKYMIIMNNIYRLLCEVPNIDHIIKPFTDLFVLFTSEKIMQKVNTIIENVKDCLDNYLCVKNLKEIKYEIINERK
jgi:hypothetical protein